MRDRVRWSLCDMCKVEGASYCPECMAKATRARNEAQALLARIYRAHQQDPCLTVDLENALEEYAAEHGLGWRWQDAEGETP